MLETGHSYVAEIADLLGDFGFFLGLRKEHFGIETPACPQFAPYDVHDLPPEGNPRTGSATL